MDYSRLRSNAIESGQDEEAVTVNTRALIDKVLARYSGEWTTLRELIQNAADASATRVSIRFETIPSTDVPLPSAQDDSSLLRHTLLHHRLLRLVVTNNGIPFNNNDWARLKRIAEGNPDETKIGAFGVGFYSVFSECENPLVCSGDQSMAFFWKGNSLFTRRGRVPDSMNSGETSFILDYREASSPVPNLMSICQFLSSSLTFVGLDVLELWLDKWNVFTLRKKTDQAQPVAIPRNIEPRTTDGLMKLTGVNSQRAQIDASWINVVGWSPAPATTTSEAEPKSTSLRSLFSRLTTSAGSAAKKAAQEEEAFQRALSEDMAGKSNATVFIRISTADVSTSVSSSFAAELERATKKPPPKTTRISVMMSSHNETEATMSTVTGTASSKVAQIILSALPTKNGRIFIGFPTAQTTGILAHISAPSLIPTVERENIDLNARYVRTWNEELLRAAGIASRIAYAGEMDLIRSTITTSAKTRGGSIDETDVAKAIPAAVHLLRQYTHRESTPLLKVGSLVEEAFWTCMRRKAVVDLLSTVGVLPSDEIRIATEKLSFVKGLPVVPEGVMEGAPDFMRKLVSYGFISETKITDIKKELERQALNEDQMSEFLRWAASKALKQQIDGPAVSSLFGVTVVHLKVENLKYGESSILQVGDIQTFVNSTRIPPELPLPPTTMPFRFTKGIGSAELQLLSWQELQIVPWSRWLLGAAASGDLPEALDMTRSSEFAAQALMVISKSWDQLSQSSKTSISELFTHQTVMPTKAGMRKPSDAYFASVQLFDDLPTVQRLGGVKEKFLKALGVRKTIELSVIFDRLMQQDPTKDSSAPGWNHVDLIRYLVSVWNDIPESDIVQLRNTAICPIETSDGREPKSPKRHQVSRLFEPIDALRALKLPVLSWPGPWNAYSSEGKFLKLLGLRSHPSAPELIDIIVKAHEALDIETFESGLRYFIANHHTHSYGAFDMSNVNAAFVPVESSEKRKVMRPADCFADPDAAILGYPILRRDLQGQADKFGVSQNPSMESCALRLIKSPPKDTTAAAVVFSYFGKRVAEIKPMVAERLGVSMIVPVANRPSTKEKQGTRHTTPRACFLGDGEEYGDIFDYVNFRGLAQTFLTSCGTQSEPTIIELTRLLIREPARIFSTLQLEKYLNLMRKLHVNMAALKKDKELWQEMKKQPFLLAYREVVTEKSRSLLDAAEQDDEDDPDAGTIKREYSMQTAGNIVVVDDLIVFNMFRNHLVAAPQEESLEDLYMSLGATPVSSRLHQDSKLGPRIGDQHSAIQLRSRLMERVRLFLHEQSPKSILHDDKWLDKSLDVMTVQSVSLRRTLRGTTISQVEKRSANIEPIVTERGRYLLSITDRYETWQVCAEVANLLISRPKPHNIMIFEMFLSNSLHQLRARGYNVDRILRRKEAEAARSAEIERQRKKEEKQKAVEEAGKAVAPYPTAAVDRAKVGAENAGRTSMDKRPQIPGAFDDSADTRTQSNSQNTSRGFFANLSKQLGFGGDEQDERLNTAPQVPPQVQHPNVGTGITANPPPYTPFDQRTFKPRDGQGMEPVTSRASVQENLERAVNASRPHGSGNVFSRPSTVTVKETQGYCDERPGHNLRHVGATQTGIRFYVSNTLDTTNGQALVQRSAAAIELFSNIVQTAGSVLNIRMSALNIFYDDAGTSIAFNTGGAIFCNFRFFSQLHLEGFGSPDPGVRARAQVDAVSYWWVTLCHELAHNLVEEHSSRHSYYTEQFVAQYFPRVVEVLFSGGGTAGNSQEQAGTPRLSGVEAAFS